jgi:hypothetical protein
MCAVADPRFSSSLGTLVSVVDWNWMDKLALLPSGSNMMLVSVVDWNWMNQLALLAVLQLSRFWRVLKAQNVGDAFWAVAT